MAKKEHAIISLEDFTESINMLLYGDSGVGKTVLAGSCPNALFLSFEPGTISAKRQGSTAKLWPIKSWSDLVDARDWLLDNPGAHDWVILDSITQMQKLCMRTILDAAVADNRSRDPDIPALQDWQKYYNMFDRFIAAFNDLPVNILYIATTMRHEDEEGEDLVLPDIQGKGYHIAQSICASVAIVAYLKASASGKGEEAEISRKLLFQSFPPFFAKDRYGVFPRWVTVTKGDQQITTMAQITRKIMAPVATVAPIKRAPAKKVPIKAVPTKAAPTRRRPA